MYLVNLSIDMLNKKRFLKYFVFVFIFIALQSCTTNRVIEVKSPCVSGEDGPCGQRKPVNTWLS